VLGQRVAEQRLARVAKRVTEAFVTVLDHRFAAPIAGERVHQGDVLEQLAISLPEEAALLDGFDDPVFEALVRGASGVLPEVAGHVGGDRAAGNRLAALAGEKDKREVRVRLANRFEELQAVHPRHVVVAHDTVDGIVRCGEHRESLGGSRRPVHLEGFAPVFEKRRRQFGVIRVVDVEHANRVTIGRAHRRPLPLGPSVRELPAETTVVNGSDTIGSFVCCRFMHNSFTRRLIDHKSTASRPLDTGKAESRASEAATIRYRSTRANAYRPQCRNPGVPDPVETTDPEGIDFAWVMQTTFVVTILLGAPIVALASIPATLPTWGARASFAIRVGAIVWIVVAVGAFLYARREAGEEKGSREGQDDRSRAEVKDQPGDRQYDRDDRDGRDEQGDPTDAETDDRDGESAASTSSHSAPSERTSET